MRRYKLKSPKMYGRKRPPRWLIGLTIILVVVGVSFGGAKLWQYLDTHPAAPFGEPSALDDPSSLSATSPSPLPIPAPTYQLNGEAVPGEYPDREAYPLSVKPLTTPQDNSYFDDALFVGDTITAGLEFYLKSISPTAKVLAGADTALSNIVLEDDPTSTEELLIEDSAADSFSMDLGEKYDKVGKVYLMLGLWDLALEEETFTENYRLVIRQLKERYPKAIIYLQSITPVTGTPHQREQYPLLNNELIGQRNLAIMNLAATEGVYYLDVASVFIDDSGALPRQASADGVYFTGEYYYRWIAYLKNHTI